MRRRDFIAGGLILGLGAPNLAFATSPPKVSTTQGFVVGTKENSVAIFRGIPYGRIGARFAAPLAPDKFSKPFSAAQYGSACPQSNKSEPNQAENCLFLNIWTPQIDNKKRPVMFYIHGGAYSNGSGSDALYDGTNLCLSGDVVVVTINHRLNAFGYLYLSGLEREINGTDSYKFSGNVGQLDIIAALKWVKSNISGFGGNPDNIMVFGQSGGGAKIATLLATPVADGLFSAAATMSGQQVTASGQANASARSRAFLSALGLKADAAGLAALQSAPFTDIVSALAANDPVIGKGGLYMGPVYDNALLFRHPFYPDAAPQARKIPLIIGNTHDETRFFLGNSKDLIDLDWHKLEGVLQPQYRVDIDPREVIAKYREIYPQYSPEQVYFAATTAGRSWRAAIIEAEMLANANAPAYVYQLDWQSPKDGGKWGACHTMDIPLVFQNTAATGALSGDDTGARQMAKIMSNVFINFARSGNPNCAFVPEWQKYQLPARQTMIFDTNPHMVNDPRGRERELFAKVPFIQQGT